MVRSYTEAILRVYKGIIQIEGYKEKGGTGVYSDGVDQGYREKEE